MPGKRYVVVHGVAARRIGSIVVIFQDCCSRMVDVTGVQAYVRTYVRVCVRAYARVEQRPFACIPARDGRGDVSARNAARGDARSGRGKGCRHDHNHGL